MTPSNPPAPHEEEPTQLAPAAPNAAPSTPANLTPRPPRQRLRVLAAGAVTLAVVAMFALAVALIGRNAARPSGGVGVSSPQGSVAPQLTAIPAGWHVYHDPGGYFTVALPDGWTATRSVGTATIGAASGSDAATIIMLQFGEPPQGSKTITVEITVQPIDDFLRRMACQGTATPYINATVAGMPATYLPTQTWLLKTNAASFQIDYFYPGYTGDIAQTSAPTPIPQAELTQGQHEMATILATFRPNPDTPFTCP